MHVAILRGGPCDGQEHTLRTVTPPLLIVGVPRQPSIVMQGDLTSPLTAAPYQCTGRTDDRGRVIYAEAG